MAVALHAIREIVPCDAITRVPHVPPFVRGVVNLRGQVLPVVDLAAHFGLAAAAAIEHRCLIVVDAAPSDESATLGLLIDAVNDVLEPESDAIGGAPPFGLPIDRESVTGIVAAGERVVIVLDLERVLQALERAMNASLLELAG